MDNTVFDYYIYAKRRFKWLIIVPIIFGVLGILYSTTASHKYVGQLTFVSNNDNNSSPYSILMQQVGIDIGSSNGAFEGDNLIEFLKTRYLVEKTLLTPVVINNKQLLLVDYYTNVSKLRSKWDAEGSVLKGIRFTEDRSHYTTLQDSALKVVYLDISPSLSVDRPDKKLSIIGVGFSGTDQAWVKAFVETLMKNATEIYIKNKTAKLQENVDILQFKVDSINGRVSGSLSSIATTEDINVNPTRRAAQIPIQRQQINLQVNNAILAELIKNLELAKIQLQKETPFIQVLDKPTLPLDDKKTGKLLSGIAGALIGGVLTLVFFVGQIQFIKLKKKILVQKASVENTSLG